MVKKKNILFVCKHNVFRSKFAEEYMKKINEVCNIASAGVIQSKTLSCSQNQIDAAKEFGVDMPFDSKTLSIEELREQDLVIIRASDIPKEIFDNPLYELEGKLEFWDIDDVENLYEPTSKNSKEILKQVAAKIDELNERLISE